MTHVRATFNRINSCFNFSPWKMDGSSDNEAPKDPGVCQQRYTEQDYEGMHVHVLEESK